MCIFLASCFIILSMSGELFNTVLPASQLFKHDKGLNPPVDRPAIDESLLALDRADGDGHEAVAANEEQRGQRDVQVRQLAVNDVVDRACSGNPNQPSESEGSGDDIRSSLLAAFCACRSPWYSP